jgi:hypothetical protein
MYTHIKKNSVALVLKGTIPTEQPQLVGEVIEGAMWSAWRIPTAVFSTFYTGAGTFSIK